MANQTPGATVRSTLPPANASIPLANTGENSKPGATGMGDGRSSLITASETSFATPLIQSGNLSPVPAVGNGDSSSKDVSLNGHQPPPLVSGITTSEKKEPASTTKAKSESDPAPVERSSLYSYASTSAKLRRISQRFLVRCPHTFIAIGCVFVPLYYGLGKEKLAYDAATFVAVGGTVYCAVRAIFLEIIPEWMLPRNDDTRKWRHLMNATYTGFITVMFTSAVWKLDLSATAGLTFLSLSFGVPYIWLAKLYPDIDKQQVWG